MGKRLPGTSQIELSAGLANAQSILTLIGLSQCHGRQALTPHSQHDILCITK